MKEIDYGIAGHSQMSLNLLTLKSSCGLTLLYAGEFYTWLLICKIWVLLLCVYGGGGESRFCM